MKLGKLKDVLEAEVQWGDEYLSQEITIISGSDLLSDVLAFAKAGTVLLTGLTNSQVVRTAEMVDISAICFIRGKKPQKETIELAKEKKIPLLATKLSMYESCGRLYKEGLPGRDNSK